MKAVVYDRYGPADVVRIEDVSLPKPRPGELLIRVHAASVSTADWRLRAAAFPGVMALPGRLMFGVFRPRNRVLGADFAGEVVDMAHDVTGFAVGDRVYGFSGSGAHAEFLTMKATGAVAPMPEGFTYEEAAALPFGALSALVFLRDFAKVRDGERVLILGASGSVGSYATQIARALGAEVTGVAGATRRELIEGFGADFVDYRSGDPLVKGSWDVIFDTVGAVTARDARRALKPGGRFVPLNFGLGDILRSLLARVTGGPQIVLGVSGDTSQDLKVLSGMLADGKVRPVLDRVYPIEQVREAYAHVESRHKAGSVVLRVAQDHVASFAA